MKIQIEATDKLTKIDGVPVRLWEGTTESGVKCKVFVHRVVVSLQEKMEEFAKELQEQLPPGRHVELRHIL